MNAKNITSKASPGGKKVKSRIEAGPSATSADERLLLILETAPDPVIVIDESGIVQSFNAASVEAFGYAPEEVIGQNVRMLMPSPDQENHDSYIARYLDTNEPRIIGIGREVTARRKDGTLFPARLAISEATMDGRRLFTGFLQNLTAQKEAEEEAADSARQLHETQAQLYHASRYGDLGEMASAIAHEINQPLTAILNYVQTCRSLIEASGAEVPENVPEYLDRTAAQADRAGLIIRRLRQLYERGDVDMIFDDLNKAVEEALDLALIGATQDGVTVSTDLGDDLGDVSMDRQQIQQVVINLVRNAIEALGSSRQRELVITTRRSTDGGKVELSVSDTGPGLPRGIAENLFAPFQTTKPTGMGLGLSICRSIVESHGGRIWAAPNPGGGTVFSFSLNTRA